MRVALIGAGYFGQFHIDAWKRAEGADLAAIVDPDLSKAEAAGVPGFADALEMVETVQPDIIDIASPPPTSRSRSAERRWPQASSNSGSEEYEHANTSSKSVRCNDGGRNKENECDDAQDSARKQHFGTDQS